MEQNEELVQELEKLRSFIEYWQYEGHLQTVESRCKFRKDAEKLLMQKSTQAN